MKTPAEYDRERRRIVRQVGVLVLGLGAGAVFFAILGGALLAWIFTGAGLPFFRTWLLVSVLLLAIPVAIHLAPKPWRRGGEQEGGEGDMDEDDRDRGR